MKKRIPITKAKDLSKEYGWDEIIIIGIDSSDESGCVTTYGATKKLCKCAGDLGNSIATQVIGWEEKPKIIKKESEKPPIHTYNKCIMKCKHLEYDMDGEHCALNKGIGVSNSCQLRHDQNTCSYFEIKEDT